MVTQWTIEAIRDEHLRTIPVLLEEKVVEAEICKFDNPADTTLQIGSEYYGTTWAAILDALNAGKPLELVPNADKSQE